MTNQGVPHVSLLRHEKAQKSRNGETPMGSLVLKSSVIIALALAALTPTLAVAQSVPQASPAGEGISSAQLARIKVLQNQYVKDGKLAGGAILVARNGKVVYFDTFGAMDQQSGKAMTKDAIFRIYSMSKPVIAVAALTLYE